MHSRTRPSHGRTRRIREPHRPREAGTSLYKGPRYASPPKGCVSGIPGGGAAGAGRGAHARGVRIRARRWLEGDGSGIFGVGQGDLWCSKGGSHRDPGFPKENPDLFSNATCVDTALVVVRTWVDL